MLSFKQSHAKIQAILDKAGSGGGGTGGTTDYTELSNKPQINSVTLSGNKTTSDLGIDEVPEVTSSDKGKVLTAGNTGEYQWKNILPPITNSDNEKLVRVAGNGYSYVSSYRLLPPEITSRDDGKVLVAKYGVVGEVDWDIPPIPKSVTTLDPMNTQYTLGTYANFGLYKFIIYATNPDNLIPMEFCEGYYYKNTSGPVTVLEPYASLYSHTMFDIHNDSVDYMGPEDERVYIIEIPINTVE